MAKARATLKLDQGQMQKELMGTGKAVPRLVNTVARRTAQSAKSRTPVDTGNLRNSINQKPLTVTGLKASTQVVADAEYSLFVHDGTAPVIYPKKGKFLKFQIGDRTIYAKSVRGQKPRPFLTNALKNVAPRLGFTVED